MKKRKSLISAVGVLLLLTGFILMPHSNPPSPPPVPLDSRFLIGAMQTFYDQGNDYGHYDSLGFNLWHNYNTTELSNGRHYPSGLTDWDPDDKLFNPVSDYAANIRAEINELNNHNTSRLMLGRPKIEWLCYGQRSDYQFSDFGFVIADFGLIYLKNNLMF